MLSIQSLSELPTSRGTEAEEILMVTDQSVSPSTLSSPPTSYHPAPASSSAGARPPTKVTRAHIRMEGQYRTSGSGSSTKDQLDPRRVGSVWT